MRRELYPPDWPAISLRIRARADNRCEGSPAYPECRAEYGQPHPVTGSKVVLSVGHWPDPTPTNCNDSNLHCWCARCHLAMDRDYHIANAAATRRRKRVEAGQMEMFGEGIK